MNEIDDRSDEIISNNLIAELMEKVNSLRADNARLRAAFDGRIEMCSKLEVTLHAHQSALKEAKVALGEIGDESGFVQGAHLSVSYAMRARAKLALTTINKVLGDK